MTRFKRAVRVAFFSTAAGMAGYAVGIMFAPASGAETRRSWTRRAKEGWSERSRSCERMFERVSAYAKREIDARMPKCAEAVRPCEKID